MADWLLADVISRYKGPLRQAQGRLSTALRMTDLFGEEIVERPHGGELVVFDVEDRVELGDEEDIVDFLREVEKLEFASGISHRGEAADKLAHARAVDVVDAGEVEDDLLFAVGDKGADGVAEIANFIA